MPSVRVSSVFETSACRAAASWRREGGGGSAAGVWSQVAAVRAVAPAACMSSLPERLESGVCVPYASLAACCPACMHRNWYGSLRASGRGAADEAGAADAGSVAASFVAGGGHRRPERVGLSAAQAWSPARPWSAPPGPGTASVRGFLGLLWRAGRNPSAIGWVGGLGRGIRFRAGITAGFADGVVFGFCAISFDSTWLNGVSGDVPDLLVCRPGCA